ncbi:MAG TPA: glycosyltransferase family 2 protein [Anaerolineae bacterium]|nr:glycosyltransferase family 2 protein [Anaerolineae bacterium]
MSTLSVIIPAYNEEDGIASVIDRVWSIESTLRESAVDLELIIVDDGSKDRTAEVVKQYPRVRLIQHAVNDGYGAAIKTGFNAAAGEYLAFLDADGTYPPEHLPNLYRALIDQQADLVIGSRMAGASTEMPFVRRVGNMIFAHLVSLLGRQYVSDSASGLRLFKRNILSQLYPLPDGLNFTPVMSTRAVHEHLKIIEVAVPYKERIGRSKLNVVRDGVRFTNSIVWTVLSYNPVRVFGLLGMGLIGLAFLFGVRLLIERVQGITQLDAFGVFSVYAMLVLSVSGVSLFVLGVTFNYLISLLQNRPVRQGLFGKPMFKVPLEQRFGWLGIVAVIAGIAIGGAVWLTGYPIERLWLYLLISALLILSGLQLIIAWLLVKVLSEVKQREVKVKEDMAGSEVKREQ